MNAIDTANIILTDAWFLCMGDNGIMMCQEYMYYLC